MSKDNQNLITDEDLQKVSNFSSSGPMFDNYIKQLIENEPKAFSYITQSIFAEIEKLGEMFSGLFEAYPLLVINLNKTLMYFSLRAMLLSELKWKPKLPETFHLSDQYKVKLEDFD